LDRRLGGPQNLYGRHGEEKILDLSGLELQPLGRPVCSHLGVKNRINETLRITIELKITSQVISFIKQILFFLAHGGSCTVKTELNPFHVRRMVTLEVEISANVDGFPINFSGF
jgi:hypothetical protein